MEAFIIHTGILATLNRSNVDTDQIIPKQFLKSILRTGYGPNAFFDWRYDRDGRPRDEFELNSKRFDGRTILVTRNNFGCGSSREHAVWALVQDNFRLIIAPWKISNGERVPGFADIFKSNAVKNGLLTLELSEDEVDGIFALVDRHPGLKATVDLPAQRLTVHAPDPVVISFEISAGDKERLVGGLDDITMSLTYDDDITRFEKSHRVYLPSEM